MAQASSSVATYSGPWYGQDWYKVIMQALTETAPPGEPVKFLLSKAAVKSIDKDFKKAVPMVCEEAIKIKNENNRKMLIPEDFMLAFQRLTPAGIGPNKEEAEALVDLVTQELDKLHL